MSDLGQELPTSLLLQLFATTCSTNTKKNRRQAWSLSYNDRPYDWAVVVSIDIDPFKTLA